ncbi:MAG: alpha/beta fold hydrolase [Rhizobiaceae bacterium]|nr:alpha/beta fold hydrolase [Rhizobiaceae bacterium]
MAGAGTALPLDTRGKATVTEDGADRALSAQVAKGDAASLPATESGETAQAAPSSVYRDVDRLFHAWMSSATLGLSPVSLAQAWQDWALHLMTSPGKQRELQTKAVEKAVRFQHFLARCMAQPDTAAPCISPLPQDRRFQHPSWQSFPYSAIYQSFLLSQQWWHNATTDVQGVTAKHEQLVEFYSRQLLDMLSPSNQWALNPEVIDKTLRAGGANLLSGFQNLVEDFQRTAEGKPPPGAEHFRPGVEVAVTPGDVVFRNELIELIRYRPTTETVRAEPILIVPAWIMKYYILDLSPGNSLVRYLVDSGFTVFCISWRNPGRGDSELGLEDYRKLGIMAALDEVAALTAVQKVHGVGYCLGGTLLTIAAAAMARDGDNRLASLSLFAAQADFEEPGELGLFIDESQISLLEDVMWAEGMLDQRRMAGAFQMLRSQDLVWSRMVHEYLMGERAPMTDLMAWNADATRMPFRMHSEYLRQLYLHNDLAQGRFRTDGRAVHVEDIDVPVFGVGTVTDHVAPWRSVFKLTHLLDTDMDFVLTSGGHNAGIVSEPGHPHRSYRHLKYRHGEPHPDPDEWAAVATEQQGSWWPAWVNWLRARPGHDVPANSVEVPSLCPAPGTYVLQP